MIIDVSGILKETGGKILVDDTVSFADMDFMGESFHFSKPLSIKGSVYNNGKCLRFEAEAKGEMQVHCARCMCPVTVEFGFDVSESFMREEDGTADDEDVILFSGNKIELDDILADCFFMNVSGKYLCSEDCKGLCPTCGKNLNTGDCDCTDDDIDPRWEALKRIMDKT